MRLETVASACIDRGWVLLLSFSVAVTVVGVVRRVCRGVFGAERALQLWLLVPLTMLAAQLPHVSPASTTYPLLSDFFSLATIALRMPADGADATARHVAMLAIWCAGFVVASAQTMRAQRRYLLRLQGSSILDASLAWPVLRATHVDMGPALVGAWRVRIVVPCDFHQRYDSIERALILAHEATHAKRHDGLWCLFAQILCLVFWFNPLAWMGRAALRLDQELACDAVVLSQHHASRRRYANALLKTQVASLALPVGCSWSRRHPVTERIAMLKLHPPSRRRRLAGSIVLVCSLAGFTGVTYAVSQSGGVGQTGQRPLTEYQLDITARKSARPATSSEEERASLSLCTAAGKAAVFTVGSWKVRTVMFSAGSRPPRIDLAVLDANDGLLAQSHGVTPLGEAMHVDMADPGKGEHYAFVVTPRAGCPARTQAALKSPNKA